MATAHTKKQLLEAAETLFLRSGSSVSTREITEAAGVGIAAVNYHFGSKENLLVAIAMDINADLWAAQEIELKKLSEADEDPTMDGIVRAFLAPYEAMMARPDGRSRVRLVMQIISASESPAREQLVAYLSPLKSLILDLMRRASPTLSPEEAYFRLRSLIAVVLLALQGGFRGKLNDPPRPVPWLEGNTFLLEYLASMLDAPPLVPDQTPSTAT